MEHKKTELEQINQSVLFEMTHTVREKTWKAVKTIATFIQPGMTEKEAIKKANEYLASQGVKKFWHKTHIRFGRSTVLSFDDPYHEQVVLKENDIFFIDIGPVWNNVESDCGDTFVVGNDQRYLQIKQDVKILFDRVKLLWHEEKLKGTELYRFAQNEVAKMGYLLYPSYVKGHRLSEFSHQKYTTIGMADLDFYPSEKRWVLELQICDKSLTFGAFYEDLLD